MPSILIVGAGPAGLAVAGCLARKGIASTVLERASAVGASWRGHYDRLHLHTPKEGSALPGLPFGPEVSRYPSRGQVIAYLERYAATLGIAPRFGEEVRSIRRVNGEWAVATTEGEHRATSVVVATGYNRVPQLPSWPGQGLYRGSVIHSAAYRNGEPYRGQHVLVVGFGNSGGEIAIDLVEHGARVSMAVRGPVNVVPRDILGIPAQRISIAERRLPPRLVDAVNGAALRFIKEDLSAYGLHRSDVGPATQVAERGRLPLIDIGTIGLIKQGRIRVRPGLTQFTANGVTFTDGTTQPFDAVVLATGYQPRVSDLIAAAAEVCDARGTPRTSGQQTALPGLYFCGFRVTSTGLLREIGLEAGRLAELVGRKK